ncbi:unnamed protein product, partial [Sphacelaria rigidula]
QQAEAVVAAGVAAMAERAESSGESGAMLLGSTAASDSIAAMQPAAEATSASGVAVLPRPSHETRDFDDSRWEEDERALNGDHEKTGGIGSLSSSQNVITPGERLPPPPSVLSTSRTSHDAAGVSTAFVSDCADSHGIGAVDANDLFEREARETEDIGNLAVETGWEEVALFGAEADEEVKVCLRGLLTTHKSEEESRSGRKASAVSESGGDASGDNTTAGEGDGENDLPVNTSQKDVPSGGTNEAGVEEGSFSDAGEVSSGKREGEQALQDESSVEYHGPDGRDSSPVKGDDAGTLFQPGDKSEVPPTPADAETDAVVVSGCCSPSSAVDALAAQLSEWEFVNKSPESALQKSLENSQDGLLARSYEKSQQNHDSGDEQRIGAAVDDGSIASSVDPGLDYDKISPPPISAAFFTPPPPPPVMDGNHAVVADVGNDGMVANGDTEVEAVMGPLDSTAEAEARTTASPTALAPTAATGNEASTTKPSFPVIANDQSRSPPSLSMLKRAATRVDRLWQLVGSAGEEQAWAALAAGERHRACRRLADYAVAGGVEPFATTGGAECCRVGLRLCRSSLGCLAMFGRLSPAMWTDLDYSECEPSASRETTLTRLLALCSTVISAAEEAPAKQGTDAEAAVDGPDGEGSRDSLAVDADGCGGGGGEDSTGMALVFVYEALTGCRKAGVDSLAGWRGLEKLIHALMDTILRGNELSYMQATK